MTPNKTIKILLQCAAEKLIVEEAKLEAQLLLQHVLNVNRAWLITHENDVLEPNSHEAFETLLNRRLNGEPIAYILGSREFYGLSLMVTPDTLIPRSDTEILVEVALEKIQQKNGNPPLLFTSMSEARLNLNQKMDLQSRANDEVDDKSHVINAALTSKTEILDLGTGTGAIALALAKNHPKAIVTAVDKSTAALKIAKKNAKNLSISNVQFVLSHWFDHLMNKKFDIIISNPPYIEQNDVHLSQGDLRFEPISALVSGADGLDDIRQIIGDCLIHLKPQGWLLLEHGYNQAELVADLMAQTGLTNIETIRDLGGNHRVTIGKNPLIINMHWD